MRVLILSDGKAGHLGQSLAFAKLKKCEYDIIEFKNDLKFLTYILDFFHIYINLFSLHVSRYDYKAIISTGSATYYANKYLAKKLGTKSIALMLPQGFRYSDFDYIFAQSHDNPPKDKNIIEIPINFSFSKPKGYLQKNEKQSLAIILGGDNKIFKMRVDTIKKHLDNIFETYPNHLKYITTSRRTPKEVEQLLEDYAFDYKLIYSQEPTINPIGDFLQICAVLFISIDSTSMLSEAKANSEASLHVIDLVATEKDTKYHKIAKNILALEGRFDYTPYLQKVTL
ncbi:MAG: mitochondrial fission ELM1 family protein [Sulfurospirillum sp.]|nr:mitochondrial fission ELM1 family protein [Sulfurospirillum sp.]